MNIGDRSRIRLLDKLAKSNGWRSLCIVGVKDDLEAKSLIQWCRSLAVTVVWRQRQDATRQEKARQARCRDRMRQWTGVYKRFTLVEDEDALAGQQFDAVALWGMKPGQLAKDGAEWAALVRDGGMLVGTDHRVAQCRAVLNTAVAEWRMLRDGVWLVEVKRTAQPEDVGDSLAAAHGLEDGSQVGAAGPDEVIAVNDGVTGVGELVPDAAANVLQPGVGQDGHESTTSEVSAPATIAPKRRGGRPKGSRNKPKVVE